MITLEGAPAWLLLLGWGFSRDR